MRGWDLPSDSLMLLEVMVDCGCLLIQAFGLSSLSQRLLALRGLWDFLFPIRDQTWALGSESMQFYHWTARELPRLSSYLLRVLQFSKA